MVATNPETKTVSKAGKNLFVQPEPLYPETLAFLESIDGEVTPVTLPGSIKTTIERYVDTAGKFAASLKRLMPDGSVKEQVLAGRKASCQFLLIPEDENGEPKVNPETGEPMCVTNETYDEEHAKLDARWMDVIDTLTEHIVRLVDNTLCDVTATWEGATTDDTIAIRLNLLDRMMQTMSMRAGNWRFQRMIKDMAGKADGFLPNENETPANDRGPDADEI